MKFYKRRKSLSCLIISTRCKQHNLRWTCHRILRDLKNRSIAFNVLRLGRKVILFFFYD